MSQTEHNDINKFVKTMLSSVSGIVGVVDATVNKQIKEAKTKEEFDEIVKNAPRYFVSMEQAKKQIKDLADTIKERDA